MPVCPSCHAEYADGREECIDCGVALVDDLFDPDAEDDEDELVEGKFVPFRSYPTRVHAEMIVEALAHEGIPAIIKSDELFGSATGVGTGATPKIVVWVPSAQKDEAADVADGTLDHL
jgi:hypothetical protein